jgi:CopG family nickel-responsive transcriptional regulator
MPIVSLFLPEHMLESLDEVQRSVGFSKRSEMIRAALRMMIEDMRAKDSISGNTNAVIIVTHDKDNEVTVTKLKHEFEDIVRTHVHSKIGKYNCVELFLLEGEGQKIAQMARLFERDRSIRSVKLVTI